MVPAIGGDVGVPRCKVRSSRTEEGSAKKSDRTGDQAAQPEEQGEEVQVEAPQQLHPGGYLCNLYLPEGCEAPGHGHNDQDGGEDAQGAEEALHGSGRGAQMDQEHRVRD